MLTVSTAVDHALQRGAPSFAAMRSGRTVVNMAGDQSAVADISPLLRPMCHEIVFCGSTGSGLRMKLAVNIFMLVLATGLAEAVHFADRQKLNRQLLQTVLNAGPMASAFSRMKLAKLVANDYSAQAFARDGCNSTRLITNAARDAHIATSVMSVCRQLYEETVALGHGTDDMIASFARSRRDPTTWRQ